MKLNQLERQKLDWQKNRGGGEEEGQQQQQQQIRFTSRQRLKCSHFGLVAVLRVMQQAICYLMTADRIGGHVMRQ